MTIRHIDMNTIRIPRPSEVEALRNVDDATIARAISQPQRLLRDLDKWDCEQRLINFVERYWHVIEPARVFKKGWHIEAICDHLEAVTNGEIIRLLINVPPGFMKSLLCNVFWTAWEWGPRNLPHLRHVGASYSSSLTIRDNRRCRSLITCREYQEMWGSRFHLLDDQNAKVKYENDKTGWRLATSVEGVGTGERGDRVGVDDPHNVKDADSVAMRNQALQWFTEVLPSRMNDPELSAIIVIMQRVHAQDISGHILAEEIGYEHLMLPMEYEPQRCSYTKVRPSWYEGEPIEARYLSSIQRWVPETEDVTDDKEVQARVDEYVRAEVRQVYKQDRRETEDELLFTERFPLSVVERDKKVMGSYAAAGQFQQRPTPRDGAMFKRSDFHFVDTAPVGGVQVRGWDLASTEKKLGARSAGVLMRKVEGRIYIMHAIKERLLPGDVMKLVISTAEEDHDDLAPTRTSIPQDPGQAGVAQKAQYSAKMGRFDVRFSPETGDKVVRAQPLAAQTEAGNVFIVKGPWNRDFLDEICMFPRGIKDQVDAATRAYSELIDFEEWYTENIGVPLQAGAQQSERFH